MKCILVLLTCAFVLCGASTHESNLDNMADALISKMGDKGMANLEKFLKMMSDDEPSVQDDDGPSVQDDNEPSVQDDDGPSVQDDDEPSIQLSAKVMNELAKLMGDVDDGEIAKMMSEGDDDLNLAEALVQDEQPQAKGQRCRYVRIHRKVWYTIRRFYWRMYKKFGRRWRG